MTGTRFEVVPLEALRVRPGEVLVLRMPDGSLSRDRMADVLASLKGAGLDGRVLVVSGEIDLTVIEGDS